MVLGFQNSTYINSVLEFSPINYKCSLNTKISAEQSKQNKTKLMDFHEIRVN